MVRGIRAAALATMAKQEAKRLPSASFCRGDERPTGAAVLLIPVPARGGAELPFPLGVDPRPAKVRVGTAILQRFRADRRPSKNKARREAAAPDQAVNSCSGSCQGFHVGRPPKLTPRQWQEAIARRDQDIARSSGREPSDYPAALPSRFEQESARAAI